MSLIWEAETDSSVAFFATTAPDDKNYNVAYHNLDVIISAGFMVNFHSKVRFRIQAA